MKKKAIDFKFKIKVLIITLLCIGILATCRSIKPKKANTQEQIVVAKLETPVTRLFFTGTLQPLSTIPVISPIDGRVDSIDFVYGSQVTKGQVLLVLNSSQLAEQFQTAVADYLQKKQAYYNSIESFQGSTALYNAGVMSKEAFRNDKNQYENNTLSYFQSTYKLQDVLKKVNLNPVVVEQLSLANPGAVNELLKRSISRIEVKSPGSGVALFPTAESTEEKQAGKLRTGSEIKTGQLLLSIGDLSGLTTQIQVNEISIARIKSGMDAVITGDAFPGQEFKGKVDVVSTQANPDSGGGGGGSSLSLFNVTIRVPQIPPAAIKLIRVGMTAKVEIDIKEPSQLLIPVQAVWKKNNTSMVTVEDPSGKRRDVEVMTGNTTPTSVEIIKGLKPGDRVVIKQQE